MPDCASCSQEARPAATEAEPRCAEVKADVEWLETEVGAGVEGLEAEFQADIEGLEAEFEAGVDVLEAEVAADVDGREAEFEAEVEGLEAEFEADDEGLEADVEFDIEGLAADVEAGVEGLEAEVAADVEGDVEADNEADAEADVDWLEAALEETQADLGKSLVWLLLPQRIDTPSNAITAVSCCRVVDAMLPWPRTVVWGTSAPLLPSATPRSTLSWHTRAATTEELYDDSVSASKHSCVHMHPNDA